MVLLFQSWVFWPLVFWDFGYFGVEPFFWSHHEDQKMDSEPDDGPLPEFFPPSNFVKDPFYKAQKFCIFRNKYLLTSTYFKEIIRFYTHSTAIWPPSDFEKKIKIWRFFPTTLILSVFEKFHFHYTANLL